MSFLKNLMGCILSAVLLVISYPQIEWWLLAWIGLVPLLLIIERKSYLKAFAWTLTGAFLFFFGTLGWLVYVTYPGTLILCLYLALYPAFFALGFVFFQKLPLTQRVLILSCLWTALEFLRANLFTGFGWATLGHSQYKNLYMVQIADIIGLYGISFMVILVNLTIFEIIRSMRSKKKDGMVQLLIITASVLAVSFGYGAWTFFSSHFSGTVKVAVVQPNIPQEIKWDPQYMPGIVRQTLSLSDQAAWAAPDFILWPETSLPGILNQQPAYQQQIQLKAMDLKIPMMIGAINENLGRYYNSAIFIGSDGVIQGHYLKIHLVPFGEFLPLRPVLGWLNSYIGLEDFSSGKEYTLFPAGKFKHSFGVLICFEDALGYLWRNFVKEGAVFMVNMTNDAWFMDTKEPFMHLQGAVMECIKNKRSLARAANTGVSGFVDPLGRIMNLAHDDEGKKTFVKAVASAEIPVNEQLTFYTKYGDVFTYLCFLCILGGDLERKEEQCLRKFFSLMMIQGFILSLHRS